MKSSTQSPKEPSRLVGWSLIAFALALAIVCAVLIWVVGNANGGAVGGGIQGLAALFVIIIPYKIIIYGRRRMAERAEKLLDLT